MATATIRPSEQGLARLPRKTTATRSSAAVPPPAPGKTRDTGRLLELLLLFDREGFFKGAEPPRWLLRSDSPTPTVYPTPDRANVKALLAAGAEAIDCFLVTTLSVMTRRSTKPRRIRRAAGVLAKECARSSAVYAAAAKAREILNAHVAPRKRKPGPVGTGDMDRLGAFCDRLEQLRYHPGLAEALRRWRSVPAAVADLASHRCPQVDGAPRRSKQSWIDGLRTRRRSAHNHAN